MSILKFIEGELSLIGEDTVEYYTAIKGWAEAHIARLEANVGAEVAAPIAEEVPAAPPVPPVAEVISPVEQPESSH